MGLFSRKKKPTIENKENMLEEEIKKIPILQRKQARRALKDYNEGKITKIMDNGGN